MMCFILHEWGKWEEYVAENPIILGRLAPKKVQGLECVQIEQRQKRVCRECGKTQDVKVRYGG